MARGSIVRRGKKYSVVYYYAAERKYKWESGFERRKDAEDRLRQRLGELREGTYVEPTRMPFSEYADRWLRDYCRGAVKPRTFEEYNSHIRTHLVPAFGKMDLRQITPHRIQAYLGAKLEKGTLAPKSIGNTLIVLGRMLQVAVEWGYLSRNPAARVKKPRVEPKEMDYLNPDEIRRFLQAVDRRHYALFLTAIMTGLRQGELLGLQWGDIQGTQIRVRRSLYWYSRGPDGLPRWTVQSPKSHSSKREIDLAPVVMDALKTHRRARTVVSDWIFANARGGPLDPKNLVRRDFHTALHRAKLRRIRFHSLRHTYAALQISAGANVKYLQRQMGHSSAQITLDRYGHLFPDEQRTAAAKLQQVVFANTLLI